MDDPKVENEQVETEDIAPDTIATDTPPDIAIVRDSDNKKHFWLRLASSGLELELNQVPLIQYNLMLRSHLVSMPTPPTIEVKLARRLAEEKNPTDPHYRLELEVWDQLFSIRQQHWFFLNGIKGNPPDDFECDWEFLGLDPNNASDRKLAWVSTIAVTAEDVAHITQAVSELMQPTEEAIWTACQEFKSVGEWRARSRISREKPGREQG